MEFIFIILVAGAALLVPVGSLLGFLAFRQRDRHASRVEALSREVATLRQELAALKSGNAFGEFAQATADLAPEQAPRLRPFILHKQNLRLFRKKTLPRLLLHRRRNPGNFPLKPG